jgi:Globin
MVRITCSFKSIDIVLSTWHQVKQRKSGNEKDIGMEFIYRLFKLLPQTKHVFGIIQSNNNEQQQQQVDDKVLISKNDKRLQKYAMEIIDSFDCILSSIGPDLDDLDEFIMEYSTILSKSKMSKLCVLESIQAIKETIISCFGENNWNDQYDNGWDELLTMLSGKMVQYMS